MSAFSSQSRLNPVMIPTEHGKESTENDIPLLLATDGQNNAFYAAGSEKSYKDVLFLLLFFAHLLILVATAFSYGLISVLNEGPRFIAVSKSEDISVSDNRSLSTIVFCGLLIILATATISSLLWIFCMSRLAHTIVNAVLLSLILMPVVSGTIICLTGYYSYGVVLIGLAIAVLAVFSLVRPRLEFMLSNLTVATSALLDMPYTFFYTLLVLLMQTAFVVVWALAVVGVATNGANISVYDKSGHEYQLDECWSYEYHNTLVIGTEELTCSSSGTCKACVCDADTIVHYSSPCYTPRMYAWPFILLLLSLFWTCAVLSNIVHCTTAASLSSWWILPNPSGFIVHEAFVRATTTSLGSICLGSLLVAIVRVMRSLIYYTCRQVEKYSTASGVLRTLQSCFLYGLQYFMRLLDWLVAYFNRYALCFVAIYRYDFFKASLAATTLFSKRGWTAFLNDDLLDLILLAGHLIIGALCMAVGGIYGKLTGVGHACVALLCAAGFIGGFLISMVTLSTVSSAVSAVYVCFAENPDALEFSHPEAHQALQEAWNKLLNRNGVAYSPPAAATTAVDAVDVAGEQRKFTGSYGQGGSNQYAELQPQDEQYGNQQRDSTFQTMLASVWGNAQSLFSGYKPVAASDFRDAHGGTSDLSSGHLNAVHHDADDDEDDAAFTRPRGSGLWANRIWGSRPQANNSFYSEDVQPVERSFDDRRYGTLPDLQSAMNVIGGLTSKLSSSVFGSATPAPMAAATESAAATSQIQHQQWPWRVDKSTNGAAAFNTSLHSVDLEESTL